MPTQATIEVSFRLSDAFDEREEGRRTQYNVAVQKLSKPGKALCGCGPKPAAALVFLVNEGANWSIPVDKFSD